MMKKQEQKLYKKWYFWICVIGILILFILVLLLCFNNSGPSGHKVTICTNRDYHGDVGPCIETKEVEIVANPEKSSDCPADTKPAYNVVGGVVGIEFIGCTK